MRLLLVVGEFLYLMLLYVVSAPITRGCQRTHRDVELVSRFSTQKPYKTTDGDVSLDEGIHMVYGVLAWSLHNDHGEGDLSTVERRHETS